MLSPPSGTDCGENRDRLRRSDPSYVRGILIVHGLHTSVYPQQLKFILTLKPTLPALLWPFVDIHIV